MAESDTSARRVRRTPLISALSAISYRDRAAILSCAALIAILSWMYLVHLDRQMASAAAQDRMMAAMGMAMNSPWTASDLFFTFVMWAVMMAGMMIPSATPMILLFAGTGAQRGAPAASAAAGVFGLGYLAVWTAFSAIAALLQWLLHSAALLSADMMLSSPRISGAVLIAAGLYQLTPWKDACLTHCRSPLGFLMSHWREGRRGAFRMGAQHGLSCLGCCWALMALLFAVGIMNLLWVAGLSALVLAEKALARGRLIPRIAGALLLALGVARAL